jgi:hypothetical protein
MRHLPSIIQLLAAAVLLISPAATAHADDRGSRILNSPSRDVIRRDEPALRSIKPGGNRTTTRSLSGIVGGLEPSGGLGASPTPSLSDCVPYHERLDRTTRQLYPSRCDPTRDVDTGYPAYTTR